MSDAPVAPPDPAVAPPDPAVAPPDPAVTANDAIEAPVAPPEEGRSAAEIWRSQGRQGRQPRSPVHVEVVSAEEPPRQRLADKLREFVSGQGDDDPSDGSGTRRRNPRQPASSPTDVAHGIIVPILALGFLAVPEQYRMQPAEMSAVALPVARILLRRYRALRRLSPDLVDGIAILGVMTMYARRLQMESDQRKRAQRQRMEREYAAGQQRGDTSGQQFGQMPNGDPLAAYLSGHPR